MAPREERKGGRGASPFITFSFLSFFFFFGGGSVGEWKGAPIFLLPLLFWLTDDPIKSWLGESNKLETGRFWARSVS